jgi:1-hydroxycarotenoid 3,4-desaturase
VVVVGAGVGGLVGALLLAQRGVRVQLLEAAAEPGGKMRRVFVGGQPIDSGPTVLTMRWVFEHIFEQAGSTLAAHVQLDPLHVLARHAWEAGQRGDSDEPNEQRDRLDLYADRARSIDAVARFAGPREARRFAAFCAEAQKVYATLEAPYIRSPKPSVLGMIRALGPRGLAQLTALGPLTTLASVLARRLEHPRLRQLFARYATYCGASPWLAPATLMLVAQVEMAGVWAVRGGMHGLARALEDLARARGVVFEYGARVTQITVEGGRASGVKTADGRFFAADAVLFNGDADALAQSLLGSSVRAAVPPRRVSDRSLSALTLSVHAAARGMPLVRHNVFFHDPQHKPYRREFADVLQHGRLPQNGTVYLCAQDREDRDSSATAPAGAERMLLLVNAPPRQAPLGDEELQRCEDQSLGLLARCGLVLQRPHEPNSSSWVRTTPADFAALHPGSHGSLYGTATHGWMALFRRPGSNTRIPGLFLAGGSVHPGPGVPMAAMSGVLAAEALTEALVSTSLSRRGATSGGTSMRSAPTGGTG